MTNEFLEVSEKYNTAAAIASYKRDLKEARRAVFRNAISVCNCPQAQIEFFTNIAEGGVNMVWTGNEHNGYYAYTGVVAGEPWKLSPGFPRNYKLELIN